MSTSSPGAVACGLDALEQELSAIRSEMIDAQCRLHGRWDHLPDARRERARNLLHYLAMRRRDLRALQGALASRGLSSLGRAESQAMESVDAVLAIVRSLRGTYPYGDMRLPRPAFSAAASCSTRTPRRSWDRLRRAAPSASW